MNDFVNEVFESFKNDKSNELYYSFKTEEDLNNIEAMRVFLEDHELENNVSEDDGTMVFLFHDDYDFKLIVESFGEGDFFSHGIVVYLCEDWYNSSCYSIFYWKSTGWVLTRKYVVLIQW